MFTNLSHFELNYQSTVVGGGDKTPSIDRTDWSKFEFFGSFWIYLAQKTVLKHFKSMNNPLKSASKVQKTLKNKEIW